MIQHLMLLQPFRDVAVRPGAPSASPAAARPRMKLSTDASGYTVCVSLRRIAPDGPLPCERQWAKVFVLIPIIAAACDEEIRVAGVAGMRESFPKGRTERSGVRSGTD